MYQKLDLYLTNQVFFYIIVSLMMFEPNKILGGLCMKKKRNFKPVGDHIKREVKATFSFYEVKTSNRTFYANTKKEIYSKITDDDYTFEVAYIEYVGFYQGKEDVVCVRRNDSEEYFTVSDEKSCYTYYRYLCNEGERTTWKVLRNFSIQGYYEKFKELGVNLKNDLYKRNSSFREEVNKQMKQFNH